MIVHLKRTRGLLTVPVFSWLTILIVLLAVCAPGASPPATAADAAAPTKPADAAKPVVNGSLPVVRIGTGNNVMNTPWFIGAEKGLFLKNGVDVKVKLFNTGSEIQTALQAGELEIGDASVDVHIVSQTKEIRHKAFAFNVNDATRVFPDDMYAITLRPNSSISRIGTCAVRRLGARPARPRTPGLKRCSPKRACRSMR